LYGSIIDHQSTGGGGADTSSFPGENAPGAIVLLQNLIPIPCGFLSEMLIVHFCPIVQDLKRKSIIFVSPYTLEFLAVHGYF